MPMAFYVDFEAGEEGGRLRGTRDDADDDSSNEDGSGFESDMSEEIPYPADGSSFSSSSRSTTRKRPNPVTSSSSESDGEPATERSKEKSKTSSTKRPRRLNPIQPGEFYDEPITERQKEKSKTSSTKRPRRLNQIQSPNQQSGENESTSLITELKKTNAILTGLVKRMKNTESRIKAIEEKVAEGASTCSSSGSLSTPRRSLKRDVPAEVRRETRRVYRMLMEEDLENFCGWTIEQGVTYKDTQNQTVLSRLVREVKTLNSTFLTQQIKDAAYRFYRSKTEEESAKRRGKLQGKNKSKRRHERLVRKLQERKAIFERGTYQSKEEKEKWRTILSPDLMSSDESGQDDDKEVIISHPLPWLTTSVEMFKAKLDEAILKEKSPQAKRQRKERVKGVPSTRPCPQSGSFPSWVIKN